MSTRFILTGGQWFTPIDPIASQESGYTELFENLQFAEQRDNFLRIDLKLQYRKNKKRTTRIWELDIQNVSNQANVTYQYWDKDKNEIKNIMQMGLLPIISYRIEF